MKFQVEWQEMVSDEFCEPLCVNNKAPFVIEAHSLDEARVSAVVEAAKLICESKDTSGGYFIPNIVCMTNIVTGACCQIRPRKLLPGEKRADVKPIYYDN